MKKNLPLKEISIDELYNGKKATYEVPIYQRNYAWEKDEISALIQDVYDAYTAKKETYFIGTLVSFNKGKQVYEVVDGQQRLTTINLILSVLQIPMQNKLTYRARKKSNYTINNIQRIVSFKADEKDNGIVEGYQFAKDAIDEIVQQTRKNSFINFFLHRVHLIHYQVPKNVDLNHYFEIMNSRGEQLEKHEIVKAQLIEKLKTPADQAKFSHLWESCSEMNVYIQQKYDGTDIFGKQLCKFNAKSFNKLPKISYNNGPIKIADLINYAGSDGTGKPREKTDTFQPIMDFSNFLLVVLKLTRILDERNFKPTSFNLDDKELLNEFDKVKKARRLDERFVKRFGFNLLKAKFLLDNYIVHHSNEDDTVANNPWKLQRWQKSGKDSYPKNLGDEKDTQYKLVHLLSMFEVSFSARQRKNYLFYCLLYLFKADSWNVSKYYQFVSYLADKYFYDVYLAAENLNEINTPKPGSFDDTIIVENKLDIELYNENLNFTGIYKDGTEASAGIPLYVFNYLDYKLWEKYLDELRGGGSKEGSRARVKFFIDLGCGDFGLKVFEQFYFSRTRRSLEHFFPQAKANGENGVPTEEQINCLGNYAMIGSEANSSGSNWNPSAKLPHYWDSGKIKQVSVASIKFMVMMQKCKDNLDSRKREPGKEWIFVDITEHQKKMLDILGVQ